MKLDGIGNYYNFINRNYILILKDYLRSVGIKKYKFYAGIYSLLTNNIFINGSKVGRLFPKKIYEILGIILKFYQKYSSLNIFFKKLSDTKKVVLVNVPKYLSNDDFKIFIYRLLSLNRVINKFYFKFKSNDENKQKRCKYITHSRTPVLSPRAHPSDCSRVGPPLARQQQLPRHLDELELEARRWWLERRDALRRLILLKLGDAILHARSVQHTSMQHPPLS